MLSGRYNMAAVVAEFRPKRGGGFLLGYIQAFLRQTDRTERGDTVLTVFDDV